LCRFRGWRKINGKHAIKIPVSSQSSIIITDYPFIYSATLVFRRIVAIKRHGGLRLIGHETALQLHIWQLTAPLCAQYSDIVAQSAT
jgi:hypothetical protein